MKKIQIIKYKGISWLNLFDKRLNKWKKIIFLSFWWDEKLIYICFVSLKTPIVFVLKSIIILADQII